VARVAARLSFRFTSAVRYRLGVGGDGGGRARRRKGDSDDDGRRDQSRRELCDAVEAGPAGVVFSFTAALQTIQVAALYSPVLYPHLRLRYAKARLYHQTASN